MSDAPAPDLADRVTDLEVRLAFLERTLSDLDEVVRETADGIVRVRATLDDLRAQVQAAGQPGEAATGDEAPGGLLYEKPPHY